MRRFLPTTLIVLAWTAFVGYGFMQGFLLKPIVRDRSSEAFLAVTKDKIKEGYIGNVAIAVLKDGRVSGCHFYSVGKSVDENTLFPVASISKWVTSFGVMKLVEQKKLDLDVPISKYLTRWKLPESQFDNSKVTVRTLLSHSAGLVDGLGYNGFPEGQTVQTIEESLTKASDTDYSDGIAKVGYPPGSRYEYSGAGYTILQLLIEEISGLKFHDYMKREILDPLGMSKSAFLFPPSKHSSLAEIYRTDGTKRSMNRFTALAAAGLYTTLSDLSKFLIANVSENSVLSSETIRQMAVPTSFINEIGVYGLGPHLYSQGDNNSLIIGHDGSGNNAINTAARIDLKSGSGIIVIETGHWDFASRLADEWIFWEAGIADFVVMQRNKPYLLGLLVGGYLFILILTKHFYLK